MSFLLSLNFQKKIKKIPRPKKYYIKLKYYLLNYVLNEKIYIEK